jgi:Uracil DNA glycosylase superfamily
MDEIADRHRRAIEDAKVTTSPSNPIALLRKRLCALESQGRFEDRPYPTGLIQFPWELTGRGFFPGGDGLWREAASVEGPSRCPFPFEGIMFVGQDFGSIGKYPPQNRPWELDNVATWKFLVKRIEKSKIPANASFFTNALLGLREKGSTVGQNQCLQNQKYAEMCRSFLSYQIEIQNPRLIVIFRSVQSQIYSTMLSEVCNIAGRPNLKNATCLGRKRILLVTPHPSSDHGVIRRNRKNYDSRCNDLSEAWQHAKNL